MFVKGILDNLGSAEDLSVLTNGVFLIAIFLVGSELLNRSRIRVNNTLEQRVLLEMRRDLHTKLLRLPVSFYDQRKSGEISSRVIEDVAAVERALLDGTEQGTSAAIRIILISAYLFYLQPFLACFVFLPVPLLLIIGIFYSLYAPRGIRPTNLEGLNAFDLRILPMALLLGSLILFFMFLTALHRYEAEQVEAA